MDRARDGVSIRAWKPIVPGIREVLHARFTDHAYPSHTHDVWTLFIVDDGAIRYDLDRTARGAEPSMVTVLPPHVVHDGRPATSRAKPSRFDNQLTSRFSSAAQISTGRFTSDA